MNLILWSSSELLSDERKKYYNILLPQKLNNNNLPKSNNKINLDYLKYNKIIQ